MGRPELTGDIVKKITSDFEKAFEFFGERRDEIQKGIGTLNETERVLVKYLYAHLPLSDVGACDFDVIAGYARHGAFLYEKSEFLEGVSTTDFLQYVLAHRINSEDITDCRRFFYDKVYERVKGMDTAAAVLEANNWCYEQATYRSTSIRTASPMTVYLGGFGRCGEESTFLTTVLRSLGIPSRQVYVPRWSHSDSNHAWVEILINGTWKYTGACEPKPVLNNGWFPYAASRAMIVHSRLFDDETYTCEEVTEHDGTAVLLNESRRYLKGRVFETTVKDENGKPVEGAVVRYEIVNSSEFFPVASLKTDKNGKAWIYIGQGTVHLTALFEGRMGECFADVDKCESATVVLGEEPEADRWVGYSITAPASSHVSDVPMTEEEDRLQNEKNALGDKIRNGRQESYFHKDYVERFKEYEGITRALNEAHGNFDTLRSFLDSDKGGYGLAEKDMLLTTISDKDCRDITEETLFDALSAFEFRKDFDKEIFTRYILAQRIVFETATPYRKALRERFGDRRAEIVRDPAGFRKLLDRMIKTCEKKEYTTILSTPEGLLKIGSGTEMSKDVLFVAVLRTFGVPARFDWLYGKPQYMKGDSFVYADERYERTAELKLHSLDEKDPEYEMNYSIGMRQADGSFETIGAWGTGFTNKTASFKLAPGEYRILTCERMPSGSIAGHTYRFTLAKDELKVIDISCAEVSAREFVSEKTLPDTVLAYTKGDEGKGLLIFADPGKEPTEHVFNELLEISKMSGFPKCSMRLVLKDREGLKDPTMTKILATYPEMKVSFSDIDKEAGEVAKATEVALKGLPYICVTEGERKSLYACSGYNVGCVDVFAKIIREAE
ncbi:MAG: hypothetical protein K6G60_03315 [Lachnospiraceae bacterium]|nr:hypothetical protein [Lachnospiraceae bacterium]